MTGIGLLGDRNRAPLGLMSRKATLVSVNNALVGDTMSIYREREHLVAFLTTLYPSVGCYNNQEDPEYCVVYVETPVGQMAWQIHPDDMDLFEGLRIVQNHDWDGHTTSEKYRKLQNFVQMRRTPGIIASGEPMQGRKRLDMLLAVYDSKHVVASLRS